MEQNISLKLDERVISGPRRAASKMRTDIQALRAIAVVSVVVYHFWPHLLPGGFVGVDIFFVISGYLVGGHLIRNAIENGKVNFLPFYARRVKRILPSAYMTIVMTLAVMCLVAPINRWWAASREAIASIIYLQNLLLAHDSVDYLAQDAPDSLFRHFWSLSVEEQFYIVIPIAILGSLGVARLLKISRGLSLIALVSLLTVISFGWSVYQVASGNPAAYFTLTSRLWELGVGALLVVVPKIERAPWVHLLAVSGWGALVWGVFATDASGFPGLGALPAVLGTAILICVGPWRSSTHQYSLLESRPVQYTGDISYNLYLVHWPILVFLPLVTDDLSTWKKLAAVLVALIIAAALYHWIDRPLREVKVDRFNARKILVVGFLASLLIAALSVGPGVYAQWTGEKQQRIAETTIREQFEKIGFTERTAGRLQEVILEDDLLLPQPTRVRSLLPTGAEGRCKSNMADPFTPSCTFGDNSAPIKIALAGDSHAEQYLPAFERIVADHPDIRVDTYFHSSCPLSTAQRVSDRDRGGPCLVANEATREKISAGGYDLVVTSNRTGMTWVEENDLPTPEQGFAEVWSEFVTHGIPVVVIGDNPMMLPADGTTECLIEHPGQPQACALPIAEALPTDHQLTPAREVEGVTLIETRQWFCTAVRCPAVIGNVVVYRDEQHLSVLYAETLADELWDQINTVLATY